MSGDIDMNSNKLLNVTDPMNLGDAANKRYVHTKVKKIGDEVTVGLESFRNL
jgi:hypothetical protein